MPVTKDGITDKAREIWLAGLGVFSTVEEEGTKLFNKFIEKGRELEEKGEKFEKKAKEKVGTFATMEDITKFVEEKLNIAFETIGVSSHNEVKELSEKVDKLAASVAILAQKIEQGSKAAPKTKTKA